MAFNDQAQPRAGLAARVAPAGRVTGRGGGCSAELDLLAITSLQATGFKQLL